MELALLVAFGLYFSFIMSVAVMAVRSHRATHLSTTDLLVGGRSLGYVVTALAAHAADMSDWLFMGFPGAIYQHGMVMAWVAISLFCGMFFVWHFVAQPLRVATQRYESATLFGYFQRRFNDTSGFISLVSACVLLFFFAIYLAVGIKGTGYVLNIAFGFPYHAGALFGALIVVLYSVLGGYIAIAWVDAFQALFLLAAIIATPLVAYLQGSDVSAIIANAAQRGVSLQLIPTFDLRGVVQILVGPMGWALGYFGMPHILSKFMGARNPEDMYKSKYVGLVWQAVALSAALAVGLIGMAYFTTPLVKPELIFIKMTTALFHPFVAGLILCGFLAATLSTMDSQVLVVAGIITDDIYKNFINKKASLMRTTRVYQGSIILTMLGAFFIAYDESRSTIFGLVEYAWSGIGAAFGPLVILSLYSRRVNKYGALAGIIVGSSVAALWRALNWMPAGLSVNAIIPAFALSCISILLVSSATRD